jgi:hypothetical protein
MRKGIFTLLFLGLLTASAQDKIDLIKLETAQLPKGISYSGKIKTAVRWTDNLGDNIVITTETGDIQSKSGPSDDYRDASLYAYHFLISEDSVWQTWRIKDFINECPMDIEANFIQNTFQVTDLNKDGVGEVWLMYIVACRSDVSPADMKIIMHQSSQKFAMRGQTKVEPSKGEFMGGDYKFDKAFNEGPSEFRDFAKKMWRAHIMQKWY